MPRKMFFKKLTNVLQNSPYVLLHKSAFLIKKKAIFISDIYLTPKEKKLNLCVPKEFRHVYINKNETAAEDKALLNNHTFYWLGMNGRRIDPNSWNIDYISCFVWKKQYYQKIVTVDLLNDSDVKIPWEYSRLQHLVVMANASEFTSSDKSKEYIKNEISSWIDNNPYKYSVNWTCAMEVAIRAVNIIFVALLRPELFLDDYAFLNRIVNSLYEHGCFIKQNLETYDEYYNNHYLSDLLGMKWIALFCSEFIGFPHRRELKSWHNYADKKLREECQKQIYPDGTDYESSIAYHRFLTELFCLSVYIDRVYQKEVSQEIIDKIDGMVNFLKEIRLPNGNLPMIGDSDDGRILIFEDYSHWNRLSADFLLQRVDQYINGDLSGELHIIPSPSKTSIAFTDSGYYLLRNNRIYCFTHCGPLSLHGHGGHSHNDQLAVVLAFDGEEFVVDSGTGTYSRDPKLRNYFRSTKAHSTIELIGYEQNDLVEDKLFIMRERTFSRCLEFTDTAFVGEHSGYSIVGITHKRSITINDTGIYMEDDLSGDVEGKQWRSHFILDSDVEAKLLNNDEVLLEKNGVKVRVTFEIPIQLEKTIISKAYGETEKSIKISTEPSNLQRIITKFILEGK